MSGRERAYSEKSTGNERLGIGERVWVGVGVEVSEFRRTKTSAGGNYE